MPLKQTHATFTELPTRLGKLNSVTPHERNAPRASRLMAAQHPALKPFGVMRQPVDTPT